MSRGSSEGSNNLFLHLGGHSNGLEIGSNSSVYFNYTCVNILIDIVNLREKHKMDLEIKALEHEQKLQLLKAESEMKTNEQEQTMGTNLLAGNVGEFSRTL